MSAFSDGSFDQDAFSASAFDFGVAPPPVEIDITPPSQSAGLVRISGAMALTAAGEVVILL